jgi:hypothetical protein
VVNPEVQVGKGGFTALLLGMKQYGPGVVLSGSMSRKPGIDLS